MKTRFLPAAALLVTGGLTIALLLLGLYYMELTVSKYATGTGAGTAVRIATFQVTADDPVLLSADEIIDCNDPDDEIRYEITVRNPSETDVLYSVQTAGCGTNVRAAITPEGGFLPALSGSETVTVVLTAVDLDDRSAPEHLPDAEIVIRAEQQEAAP